MVSIATSTCQFPSKEIENHVCIGGGGGCGGAGGGCGSNDGGEGGFCLLENQSQ